MATKQEVVKKYWPLVLAIILLLFMYTCTNNKQYSLQGEANTLKKQLEVKKNELAIQETRRRILKDSISFEIKKISDREIIYKDRISKLEKTIKSNVANLDKTKEEIKTYTYNQAAKAFNKRYHTISTNSDSTSVILREDVPKKVLTELAIKDALEDNIVIKDSIISEKDSIIDGKQKTITMQSSEIKEGETSIKLSSDALKISEDLNKKLTDQTKALKVKGTISKIMIPVAFVLGLLIK